MLISQIANEFNVEERFIQIRKQIDSVVWFSVGSAQYNCKVTKASKLKANSVRLSAY
jgi:hypothetical protein